MRSRGLKNISIALFLASLAWCSGNPALAQDASSASSSEVQVQEGLSLPTASLTIDEVRAVVRDEISKNPKLILDALNSYMENDKLRQEAEAQAKTMAKKADVMLAEGYPFTGPADARISLFYYFDVNCGYCKKLEPQLTRFANDNPDIKIVYREMPILAASSNYAAQINGVLFEYHPEFYEKLHVALMKNRSGMSNGDIDRTVIEILGEEKGSELIRKAVDVANDETAKAVTLRVAKTLETAREAGIGGTPFIFVSGSETAMRGASDAAYEELTKMITDARKIMQ